MLKILDWIDKNKLSWVCLSGNPSAIHLLENNIRCINWTRLSENTSAKYLLEKYPENINWNNPSIFEYDYKKMKMTRMSMPWYYNIILFKK